jgi:hypothetical protein
MKIARIEEAADRSMDTIALTYDKVKALLH